MNNVSNELLNKNNIILIMISVTLALATSNIIKSLVNDIIMRLIEPLLGEEFEEKKLVLGSVKFNTGKFIASLFYYIIVLLTLKMIMSRIENQEYL